MGIVTRATIALAPRAERVEGFCAWIDRDSDLEAVVVATRTILRSLGAIVGGINLMNAQRVLSMVAEYPHDKVGADQAMPRAILDQQCQRFDVAPWTVAGVLYGTPQIVRKARAEVRRQFQRVCRRIRFFHRSRIALLQRCVRCLPASLRMSKTRQLNSIDAFLNMAEGRPRRVALPLAYWRTRDRKDDSTFADPAADGCILMWYSPLTPMKPKAAREIVSIVQTVCTRHGIDPLVTLTSLSATAFDVTVPLLTGLAGKAGHERVAACYRELFEVGRNAGFLPYRVGIGQMNALTSLPCTYWDVVARLKSAMDEHSLLSPGRYSPAIGPFSNPTTSDLP
jgi:4-cresol dehydrogenase (hydroxylating)